MFGLIDKKLYDQGKNTYQGGAYIYVNRKATGVRVGTSDGNLHGEVCSNTKNVGQTDNVDFSMYVHANSIELTSSYFTTTKIGTYGTIKTLDNSDAYSWNEFEDGAYLGGDIFSGVGNGESVGFNISATSPTTVPEPSSFLALAGGLAGLIGIKRRRA